MSRPNKRRKKPSRGSKAASPKSAAPGRKKKPNPASTAKPKRPAKVSKALLRRLAKKLRLGKKLARERAAPGGVAKGAAAKVKLPVQPQSPPSATGNGAPPAQQPLAAEIRSDPLPRPPKSILPRRSPNGGDYHTKYLIEIYGSLKPDGSHLLILDGKRIKIDWLQFFLLLILASHARSKAGLDSPMDLRGGDYLQPSRIEEIIQQLKNGSLLCGGRPLPECQNAYSADLLRNAKWELRQRVQRKHKNPNLLDRGDGAGYRISTPPGRIKIILLVEGADDLVFDWQE